MPELPNGQLPPERCGLCLPADSSALLQLFDVLILVQLRHVSFPAVNTCFLKSANLNLMLETIVIWVSFLIIFACMQEAAYGLVQTLNRSVKVHVDLRGVCQLCMSTSR